MGFGIVCVYSALWYGRIPRVCVLYREQSIYKPFAINELEVYLLATWMIGDNNIVMVTFRIFMTSLVGGQSTILFAGSVWCVAVYCVYKNRSQYNIRHSLTIMSQSVATFVGPRISMNGPPKVKLQLLDWNIKRAHASGVYLNLSRYFINAYNIDIWTVL